ncbi:lipopolysaccharide assembly protein LapB [Draconibacterium sediminis]|uniref:tetratricopeptide repeat protein n=1 Tax=Draconibacterium sediminis TaxID=1544798 RepID=UPI0026F36502|nr:hypothetical protein [Draconibacterium sediminis]
MKLTLTSILIFFFTLSFAQKSALEEASELVEAKKYESAYNVLNRADARNENPDITIAKTDLLLNYFVTSIMHQLFAIKDLEPNEDILDVRGSAGDFTMFTFPADTILLKLIDKYPDNYELKKELGFYYHEAHLKYQGNWLIPDSDVINKFKSLYLDAYENGVFDYWSTYGIGYAYLMNQDFKASIPYFKKSVELKQEYPSSHYNLAYAYLYTDQREKAIESAQNAMKLYEFAEYKADAARMIAVIYQELEENEKAIDFYKQADKIQANDYYTLKPLLEMELALNKTSYTERTKQFFLIDPGNPTIYKDLMSIYWSNEKVDELMEFLTTQHDEFATDDKVNGNLYFYSAVIQFDKEEYSKSKQNFEKAREIFVKVFEKDHGVFEAIDSYVKEMN